MEKQSDMIKKIIKKLWETSRTKERISEWERAFQLLKNWITKLNESTMYIAVFISPTRSESTQRERKTASNYP